MKLSRIQLRKLILGEISLVKDEAIFKKRRIPGIQPGEESYDSEVLHSSPADDDLDVHLAPEDLETMDPHEAYGIGFEMNNNGCSSQDSNIFVNELGNEIDLRIEPVEGDAPGSAMITMRGPTSTSENTITRMEAEKLHDMLGRFLNY